MPPAAGWRRGRTRPTGAACPLGRLLTVLPAFAGGLPGHLPQLRSHLDGAGRSLGDIRAVLLTHAHPGHTGVAAAARQAGADVWVHERDR